MRIGNKMKIDKQSYNAVGFYLTWLFGGSLVLAIFWSVRFLINGDVPRGLWGFSRWWDLAINPVWLILLVTAIYFFDSNIHPKWVKEWGQIVIYVIWGVAGGLSVILGWAVLIPPFLFFFPLFLALQLRLTILSLKGCNVSVYKI